MKTTLCTTTDFYDDLLHAGRHYLPDDLDALMAYCASLGSKRHEWVLDTIWSLYDADSPAGFDLLATACEAAHRHGMRFDVVFKPFEGALPHCALPDSFPRLDDVPLLDGHGGLLHVIRPFVAAHPEMRLARAPGDGVDPGGRVAAVRLVKNNAAETRIRPEDLSLWTSPVNGGAPFARYDGPVRFTDGVEWRLAMPYADRNCRVLTLAGLEIPGDARFIRIECAKRDKHGDFTNKIDNLVELANERGEPIPTTPSTGRVDAVKLLARSRAIARLGLSRYLARPEASGQLADEAGFLELCREMHLLGSMNDTTLDRAGETLVMRGATSHVAGALSPAHPEVRADWLAHVRFCIERGVDGVNIRQGNHNLPHDPWAYGFNRPALARIAHSDNLAEVERANGEAYTLFLREAADLLHAAGRELGVHVHALFFLPHEGHGGPWGPLPCNIAWQWEAWVREIADYIEFRGANMLRPESTRRVVDRIGLAAREAGKRFIYQSTRGPAVHFDAPHPHLAREIERVRRHPDIGEYNLYETAGFTRLAGNGRLEGSPAVAELTRCFREG